MLNGDTVIAKHEAGECLLPFRGPHPVSGHIPAHVCVIAAGGRHQLPVLWRHLVQHPALTATRESRTYIFCFNSEACDIMVLM